jgi:hypothetical protein
MTVHHGLMGSHGTHGQERLLIYDNLKEGWLSTQDVYPRCVFDHSTNHPLGVLFLNHPE